MQVDARDVLDPNAKTIKAFKAQIVGYFKRIGPNPWDDYRFEHKLGETIDVLPKLRIQIEKEGYDIRIRRKGKVFRVRWIPTEDEEKKLGSATPSRVRELFVSEFLELFQHSQGLGGAAVIAKTLRKN